MAGGKQTEQWSSRTGFLMAAIGFAVGLGNVWRFPYVMGENGGAAFLIVYLVCALVIALPLLVSELAIGRRGRGSPVRLLFWNTVVNILVVVILRRGVQAGIEKAVNFLMPALFICLLVMVIYAFFAGDMTKTVEFLLLPDFSKVTVHTVMVAIGQAFFSIGIGMASLITFGSYLGEEVSIPKSAAIIILADTAVALLAGFAIFPLVFAYGLEPSEGPGLIFQTLPVAFGQMPGGQVFGSIFFFLLIAAALTSCIGGIESVIAWADEHKGIARKKGSLIAGSAAWLVGFLSILSFNEWKDFYPLDFIPAFAGKTIFETFDFLAANILLLIGALATSIFIGWRVPRHIKLAAIGVGDGIFYLFWRIIVCFVVPPLLLVILVMGLME